MKVCVTGVTGFLGRHIVYTLLEANRDRRIPLESLCLIIRKKSGVTSIERWNRMLSQEPLCLLHDDVKMPMINVIDLDLDHSSTCQDTKASSSATMAANLKHITDSTHIIHCAASVNFTHPIHVAMQQNVSSVFYLLSLIAAAHHKACFIHVSTAYVCQPQQVAHEHLQPLPEWVSSLPEWQTTKSSNNIAEWQSFIDQCLCAQPKQQQQLERFPNSYCLSKCVAEHIVALFCQQWNIPYHIARPSIVGPAIEHPYTGWCWGSSAIVGFHQAILSGSLKAIGHVDPKVSPNMVPVDMVSNWLVHHLLLSSCKPHENIWNIVSPYEWNSSGQDLYDCYEEIIPSHGCCTIPLVVGTPHHTTFRFHAVSCLQRIRNRMLYLWMRGKLGKEQRIKLRQKISTAESLPGLFQHFWNCQYEFESRMADDWKLSQSNHNNNNNNNIYYHHANPYHILCMQQMMKKFKQMSHVKCD